MSHDEITTKIEIKPAKTDNIVHINFGAKNYQRRATDPKPTPSPMNVPVSAPVETSPASDVMNWARDMDLRAPWVLRLVAVLAVLILSMLVL